MGAIQYLIDHWHDLHKTYGSRDFALILQFGPANKGSLYDILKNGSVIRRLTRLTNAFSKKIENLEAAISLWFAYYNFVRPHRTLNTVPAVAAGIINHRWKLNQLLDYSLSV
jgi:transposase InsO family protein